MTEPEGSITVDRAPQSGQYHVPPDVLCEVRPSTAVMLAIASITETDPTALPPLQETVDADSLDALLTDERAASRGVTVSFRYAGYCVTVTRDDGIRIRRLGQRGRT